MEIAKKIYFIFTNKQRRDFILLIIVIGVGSIFELLGISAIMPFIAVISDKKTIHNNDIYSRIYHIFKFESDIQFVVAFAMVLILIYIVKNAYLMFMYDVQYRFTYNNQRRLAKRLVSCYMSQPYLFHLSKNISELQRNITNDVGMFYNAILSLIQLITESIVCALLIIYLLLLDKSITIGIVLILSVFAIVYLKVVRQKSIHYGRSSRKANEGMFRWIRQAFEGIKEIKILNREHFFERKIDEEYESYIVTIRKSSLLSVIPRPMFETACVTALLIVVSLKLINGVDVNYFIPVLSAFAIAAFRLLPSFGRMAGYINTISYNKSAIDAVYQDIIEAERLESDKRTYREADKLVFQDKIEIKDLKFSYPNIERSVLENANLTIPKNKSVAFVGPSGAGKSTLADLILGILDFSEGQILVDGVSISDCKANWHRILGYIPQSIYLMDDSIRNNILFGIPQAESDENRLWKALTDAQMKEFVEGLKDGIDTVIGERGVRLSGGQRQRIGIARALYNDPEVLVLDEATSALDNDTESAVMDAINGLRGQKTLIIIAHRLSTISNCDIVYEVNNDTVTCIKSSLEC